MRLLEKWYVKRAPSMKLYWKFLRVISINMTVCLVSIIILELAYGKWFKTKTFVPNILPKNGISHDLSQLKGSSGITTRIPDENGAILYSKADASKDFVDLSKCNILILGGSTAEERILDKNETWSSRLFSGLNKESGIRKVCPLGVSVTNAAVNGHSIVANYFDVIYWISRFNQSYSTAVIYQGINDFQGDLLEEPDWFDLYWQHVVYGLKYNSIFLRLLNTLLNSEFKWEDSKSRDGIREIVRIEPYREVGSEWSKYYIDPGTLKRLSVGLENHERYIRLLANALKRLGLSHTVWITQTKPFCRLQEMPETLVVRGSKTTQDQLDNLLLMSDQELRSWIAHDRLGDCIRLGLIRGSYLRSSSKLKNMGITSSVIDYGASAETDTGSYDDYHKTPDGSLKLWRELEKLGLLQTIVDHIRQLSVQ